MNPAIKAAPILIVISAPATAEIAFSGYGRFGAAYDQSAPDTLRTTSRLRIDIDASTEADNGLTFGARLRIQSDDAALSGPNGARFFARAGDFELQAGNVSGAIDDMSGFYGYEPGLTDLTGQYAALRAGFDDYASTGPGRNGVRLSYMPKTLKLIVTHSNSAGKLRTALSLAKDFSKFTASVGVQTSNDPADDKLLVATLAGSARFFDYQLFLADELAGFVFGASSKFEIGANTDLQASFSRNSANEYYGLGFSHRLGNGASLRGGIARNAGNTVGDLGVRFNF